MLKTHLQVAIEMSN